MSRPAARGGFRAPLGERFVLRDVVDAPIWGDGVMAGGVYPYLLADGSTRYSVMDQTSNSVQRRKRGFTSRQEAERWRIETLAAVYRGEVLATKETFADYVDRWLLEHAYRSCVLASGRVADALRAAPAGAQLDRHHAAAVRTP
jgi:hypothetical protein